MGRESRLLSIPDRITSNLDLKRIMDAQGCDVTFLFNTQVPKAMPSEPGERRLYIINLDQQDRGGTHWTGMLSAPSHAYYYDSFGTPPPKHILEWVRAHGKTVIYNTSQIQHHDSLMCGWYVVWFLVRLCHHTNGNITPETFLDLIQQWDPWSSQRNERKINAYRMQLIKKYYKR